LLPLNTIPVGIDGLCRFFLSAVAET